MKQFCLNFFLLACFTSDLKQFIDIENSKKCLNLSRLEKLKVCMAFKITTKLTYYKNIKLMKLN
jgi:hypothetical protein